MAGIGKDALNIRRTPVVTGTRGGPRKARLPGSSSVEGPMRNYKPRRRAQGSVIQRKFGAGMSYSISRTGTAITALLIAGFAPNVARADNADLVLQRVQLLEKELAAVKQENETLRHIKRLREENAALAKSQPPANVPQGVAPGNPRDAYAADMPIYAKAVAPVEPGRLRLWGEGGAIWSGGDPIDSFYPVSYTHLR